MSETEYLHTPLSTSKWTRRSAIRAFIETWDFTELLFSSLKNEAAFLVPPAHGLRFPMIFYYGHAAVFYVNKLRDAQILGAGVEPELERVFATGVDENSWDDLGKAGGHWTSLASLREYRGRVRTLVVDVLQTHPAFADSAAESLGRWAFQMALEHERIHLETSAVLLRELGLEHVQRPGGFPPLCERGDGSVAASQEVWRHLPRPGHDFQKTRWLEVPAGTVTLGRENDWPTYAWDCELGKRHVAVEPFSVSATLASNGDFFEFVADGGYEDKDLWSAEGWAWKEFRHVRRPQFWTEDGFRLRTLFEEVPMPWRWPALVNFHEAKAFCAHRSRAEQKPIRLITEAEHHRLRQLVDPQGARSFARWYGMGAGSPAPSALVASANFGFKHSSERAVDSAPDATGLCDVFGNAWQWCEDLFAPLEGFEPHALYPDYSVPAFDGKHHLLLGGSFASAGSQTTPWVRTNFRPHFLQMAGVRLVSSGTPAMLHA